MANVSSFSGSLIFSSNDSKRPWNVEGFLYAYDVLMSQDASDGRYGFCMEEEYTENSADFVVYLTEQGPVPNILYWGNGRWAAANNFASFDNWTKTPHDAQTMSEETYLKTRAKLLKLMYDNDWELLFEFVDEESGAGFIDTVSCVIIANYPDHTTTKTYDMTEELRFVVETTIHDSQDYTLRAYSTIIEETVYGPMLNEVSATLMQAFQVNDSEASFFKEFIVEEDWDRKLQPFTDYHEYDDCIPEGMKEAWQVYRKMLQGRGLINKEGGILP